MRDTFSRAAFNPIQEGMVKRKRGLALKQFPKLINSIRIM